MSTRIEPGEKLDDATTEAAAARVLTILSATQPKTGIAPAEPPEDDDRPFLEDSDPLSEEARNRPRPRKPRSDKGTKRGPIVAKEPEAFKVDDEFIVALTAQQLTDLNKLAEKLLAKVDLQPHHLNVSPAEWLLNARVQKHWRTLIGK